MLIFALGDDLFIFTHGDSFLTSVVMEALDEFKNISGHVPSIPKGTTYFCHVSSQVKLSILSPFSFNEGTLPLKYLGVPLISSRLLYRDYKVLVERLKWHGRIFVSLKRKVVLVFVDLMILMWLLWKNISIVF